MRQASGLLLFWFTAVVVGCGPPPGRLAPLESFEQCKEVKSITDKFTKVTLRGSTFMLADLMVVGFMELDGEPIVLADFVIPMTAALNAMQNPTVGGMVLLLDDSTTIELTMSPENVINEPAVGPGWSGWRRQGLHRLDKAQWDLITTRQINAVRVHASGYARDADLTESARPRIMATIKCLKAPSGATTPVAPGSRI